MPSPRKKPNSLRVDPTRTNLLRAKFTRDMENRFNRLTHQINDYINKKDALTLNAFEFTSLPSKLDAYKKWLLEQVNKGLLITNDKQKPWTDEYIESSYKQAATRAYADVKKQGATEAFKKEFASSFSLPVTQQRLQLLFTRAFDQLKGVTQAMGNAMSRVLGDSLAHGLGARDAAKLLIQEVGLAKQRALTVARTELIHAYAEGQLDTFDKLGITELGVEVEHLTAGDDRVCPKCAALNGKIYKSVAEARGVIPVHPNCRCAWVPYVDVKAILGKK